MISLTYITMPRTPITSPSRSDRLKPLRAFCQTARLGSVSRAAEALSVSQPAVTLQLQALERDLGIQLFERSGRRLVPTREGERLYALARPLVEGIDGLEAAFRQHAGGLDAGELGIAAGSTPLLYLLPGIVEAFRERQPDVSLTLHHIAGPSGLDLLRSDAVDLAVGSMLDVPADLSYLPAYRFEPMLITPLDHPLAHKPELQLEDLSPYGLILPPNRMSTYRMVDQVFQRNRVAYTVAQEVDDWELIKQYVAMGMGISIVTSICLTDGDRTRLAARSLAAHFPSRSYGVIVRKGKQLSPQARAFVELILPDHLPSGHDQARPGH